MGLPTGDRLSCSPAAPGTQQKSLNTNSNKNTSRLLKTLGYNGNYKCSNSVEIVDFGLLQFSMCIKFQRLVGLIFTYPQLLICILHEKKFDFHPKGSICARGMATMEFSTIFLAVMY
jgi:hypothetical protein